MSVTLTSEGEEEWDEVVSCLLFVACCCSLLLLFFVVCCFFVSVVAVFFPLFLGGIGTRLWVACFLLFFVAVAVVVV